MKAFGWTVFILGIFVLGCVLQGYTIMKLWEWFVVDFFSVSPLSFKIALGWSAFISYMFKEVPKQEENKKDADTVAIEFSVKAVAVPLLYLLWGYLIYIVL